MSGSSGTGAAGSPRTGLEYSLGLVLWIVFFCYATSAALLFQKFLLPLIPSLHGSHGLLDGDSLRFHAIAVGLAEKIKLHGWGSWSLYPTQFATGNVAILAALYALFGYDPSLIVPINAGVHALGGVLIFRLGQLLVPGKVGRTAGIVTAVLFVGFPSALNWYGQVHKDGFAIAGTLLVLYAWLRVRSESVSVNGAVRFLLETVCAVLLIALVRPYNLIPLFVVMLAVFVLTLCIDTWRSADASKKLALYVLSIGILAAGAWWARSSGINERYTYLSEGYAYPELRNWEWKSADWMPKLIDHYLETAARARAGLIVAGQQVHAGSMIDTNIAPDDALSMAAYAPRAIQIGLFAPFPAQWFSKVSPARLVSAAETLVWYLLIPGVLLALIYSRGPAMVVVSCFAILFLYLYGFTIANLGTLYRIRYPFLFLFMLIGTVGWVQLLMPRWQRGTQRAMEITDPTASAASPASPPASASRSGIFGAGAVVALFTMATYAGLFLRDVILARWFGVGPDLDALFVAMAIPTFLVAAFSIPIGTMLIPQFLLARTRKTTASAQELVSNVAFLYIVMAVPMSALLYFAAPEVATLASPSFSSETLEHCVLLFRWMLPILAMSGLVIIGNATLNALGKYAIPASAQATVPIMSILALFAFGRQFGVVAAVVGMLLGQALNLWLVARALRYYGHTPFPRRGARSPYLRDAASQYLPLVAAAIFINLAAPVNMNMAAILPAGGAAALGLGNKVVLFITGIASAAVATVILPYFSSFMARNRLLDVRNELSFFLIAATVITIPLSFLLFVASEPIVRLVFQGGTFESADVQAVARVMSYGIIQLPFYTVNLLVLKFVIATRRASSVMVVSLFGLAVNIGLNLLLMQSSGAAGIALATTLATAMSTCLMLLLVNRLGHISWVELIMVGLNWLTFTTLIICLHYHSYAGAVVAIFALVVLLYGEWTVLFRWRMAN